MSKIEKLRQKFQNNPRDFTWQELKTLLASYGYEEAAAGKISGSRVKFIHQETEDIIKFHKPHGSKPMQHYQLKQIQEKLEEQA